MKNLLLSGLILLVLPVWGQLEWGDGIEYAESNNTLYGDMAMVGDTGYYCWIEDYEGELCIKIQGFDSEGNSEWEFPVIQNSNDNLPGRACTGISDDEEIFMLWQCYSEDDEIISNYVQKLDFEGNKLWGDYGIEIINTENSCHEILPDHNGGMYILYELENEVIAWHYNESGELVNGWEEGIHLGNIGYNELSSSLSYTQGSSGELITFTRQITVSEPGVYFQEYDYNGEMEYPDPGLFIDGTDNTGLSIKYTGNDEYLLSWHNEDTVKGNKLLNNDELLYDDAVELCQDSLVYICNTQFIDGTIYLILSDSERTIMIGSYDANWQELTNPDNVEISNYNDPAVLIKDNGNIVMYEKDSFFINIFEYNNTGNLICPEEGWVNYFSYNNNLQVNTKENVINLYWKQEGQLMQTINNEGEVLYEEPRILGQDQIISGFDQRAWQTEDKLIFCSRTSNNDYVIHYLNEEGNILYSGLLGLSNQLSSGSYIISNDNNGFYIVGSIANEERPHEQNILRIDTTSEPELVWGDSGLYLRTSISSEQALYTLSLWDNLTLFFWFVDDELTGQLTDGNELLWESGGELIDLFTESGRTYLIEYIEGYLRYIVNDYPEYYEYINRINSEMEPDWEDPVLLTTELESGIYYNHVSESELYCYWVDNVDNNWKLKKQIITETGEKLCGEEGEIILETGNTDITGILTDENNDMMGIVTGQLYAPEITYFTLSGEPLETGTVSFPQINDILNYKMILKDGYVIFFTKNYISLAYEILISVYDLEGNLIPELPEPDYSVESIYESLIFEGEEAIYFTYNHKHHDGDQFWIPNGGSGIDMAAQKLSLPSVSVNKEEIVENNKVLNIYPNPFNPELTISFELADKKFIELDVYNIKGQHVRSLAESEYLSGSHEIIWKGNNDLGIKVSSGINYLKLQIDSDIFTEKAVMLK